MARKGLVVSGSTVNPAVVLALAAIPSQVIWSYCIGGLVFAIGLATIFLRGEWREAQGIEKLILFGPVFYAAPIAAFGTEHFTLTNSMAPMVPSWIPWHQFWIYFVGSCFIAAGLSLSTRIEARLAASLLGLTFFLFVVMMDAPAWAHNPRDRFALTLALRELSFSGGALALAASLSEQWQQRGKHALATIARYFVAIPVLFYSFEQFLHGDHVPGVPLKMVTPQWIYGHSIWTYLAAVVYAAAGVLLVAGKKTRVAAAGLGLTVLVVVLAVYVPIGIAERASFTGINYLGDTLMYCGAVLLLAGAMPREERLAASTDE
ncbi:MAG TPA: DoxX family membrane protein [Candidatus Acidoferrales bacterium]|nr:DoxX family membrane protein [Candidatus Acidoferrales bacterium]